MNVMKLIGAFMGLMSIEHMDVEAYLNENNVYCANKIRLEIFDDVEERMYTLEFSKKNGYLLEMNEIGELVDNELKIKNDAADVIYNHLLDEWKNDPDTHISIDLGMKELNYYKRYVSLVLYRFIVIGTAEKDLTHLRSRRAKTKIIWKNGEGIISTRRENYKFYTWGTSKDKEVYEIFFKTVRNAEELPINL